MNNSDVVPVPLDGIDGATVGISIEARNHPLHEVRGEPHVVVQEEQKFASRVRRALVERRSETDVGRQREPPGARGTSDGLGVVDAGVVDDEYVEPLM